DPSEECGSWQSVVLGAADDEKGHGNNEIVHTEDVEEILTEVVPDRFVPRRHYLINYDWNSNWKKPEARQAYIDTWSEGALVSFFLGHGSFDQIAGEGLLFIEDVSLLSCGPRLPYAFFGSCHVGVFQNPSYSCMAQKITVAPVGGAIVSSAASANSGSANNAQYLTYILEHLLFEPQFSIAECQWLGLLDHAFPGNDKPYIIFGDGSLHLALPDSALSVTHPSEMLTSELWEIDGSLNREGFVMLTAWESAVVDSYYTHNHNYLIEYLSTPGVFYRGITEASPEFTAE
ncbi:MAG: hypothetical protein GY852_09655, partial [bacterium]|nr:hypothetical protein [bacterium]